MLLCNLIFVMLLTLCTDIKDAVLALALDIYLLILFTLRILLHLSWEDRSLLSVEGVQQGDPLGPLLFCLTLHQHCSQLPSELCAMYLDDVTLGGTILRLFFRI